MQNTKVDMPWNPTNQPTNKNSMTKTNRNWLHLFVYLFQISTGDVPVVLQLKHWTVALK